MVHEAAETMGRRPNQTIVVAMALAVYDLLRAEDVFEIDPIWDVVDTDVRAAVEFREMLTRRNRWVLDFNRCFSVFERQVSMGLRALIEALPETCFERESDDDAPFTVPVSSLLERPSEVVEALMMSAYDDDTFGLNLFNKLRAHLATNMTVASGFPADTDPHTVSGRLLTPTRHKSENAIELAQLYLGGTPFADILNVPVPFHVPESSRFEHCHVIGGTGHGKTQLLQRMIHGDLVKAARDGSSVVVIDSQGDLIQKLLRLDLFSQEHEDSLADRLVLIDPADVEYPPSLNLFDVRSERLKEYSPADRERALNGLIELYETFFGDLLGAELTQKQGVIFRYLARLMLEIPGSTIHTLMYLMEDSKPFKEHMQKLDGSARYFFENEFSHPSFSATKKQILKRLWGVLSTPAFERMFAQKDNKLDLFEAINAGKIVLINTAKDLLKTDGSALFGRFFISMLAQATLERSVLADWARTPTFVYVDEAHEYFDDTIETLLNQARKYRVSITAAHQTLDQLSPRLRSAFLSNTSLKCAGGVSSKDARLLASELRTTTEFIEGMRRKRDHTEFAVWLKHRTPEALRLDVPLGFLERQPTLSEDELDELLDLNRANYCGTLDDVLTFEPPRVSKTNGNAAEVADPPEREPVHEWRESEIMPPPPPRALPAAFEPGKGGPKHRYLQSLVKELAETQGFRATIEAPLPDGSGQVDVLLTQDDLTVAVEISVTTPAEYERESVRKALDARYSRVAVVLAKARAATQERYKAVILDGLSLEERERVSFLAPEEVLDFVAGLAPPPAASESVVKGYRVRVSHAAVSPGEAKDRRDRLAKLIAKSVLREE